MKVFGLQVIWYSAFFIGLFFVFSGLLLILHPELLAFFVAGILLFIGVCFISSALSLKNGTRGSFFLI